MGVTGGWTEAALVLGVVLAVAVPGCAGGGIDIANDSDEEPPAADESSDSDSSDADETTDDSSDTDASDASDSGGASEEEPDTDAAPDDAGEDSEPAEQTPEGTLEITRLTSDRATPPS